jgi:hypothetical protein
VSGKPVTAASDIYSLGAVLYELISGARPHGLTTYDPAEIADRVCMRDIPPPSEAGGSSISGDLDTIVLKAMQKDPDRRYNSVEQFSEDLRRYLSGLPVLARPDTAAYRFRKFLGRHWVGLSATGAVIAALGAGIIISMHQARLAQERFELVRALASRFLFDFEGQIETVSGTTKAQQMVVNTAVEYLDKLSRTAGSDRALLQDLAEAYSRLAAVQGRATTSQVSHYEDALVSQQRSVEFYRKLAALDATKRRGLAFNLFNESFIEGTLSQADDGLKRASEGAQIIGELLRAAPTDPKALNDAVLAYQYLAKALLEVDRPEQALAANLKAQQYFAQSHPVLENARLKYSLLLLRQDEALMRRNAGDADAAAAIYERANKTIEELVAAEPANRIYRRTLGQNLGVLATAYYHFEYFSVGDQKKSAAAATRSVQVSRELLDSDPADGRARADIASTEAGSALALSEVDPKRAIQFGEAAIGHWDAILKATPGDRSAMAKRAAAAKWLARALLQARPPQAQEAAARAREAIDMVRALSSKLPNDPPYQKRTQVFMLALLGQALAADHRDQQAREAFGEAVSIGEQLLARDKAPVYYTIAATYAFDHFADYWKSRGDTSQGRKWFERSSQAWAARTEQTAPVKRMRDEAEEKLRGLQP